MNNNQIVDHLIDYIVDLERKKQEKRFESPISDREIVGNVKKELERLIKHED